MKTKIVFAICIIALLAAGQAISDTAQELIKKYKCKSYILLHRDGEDYLRWCKTEDGEIVEDKK